MIFTPEQLRAATMEPKGHALVKGVAGSGKTSIAIYRLHYLLQHHCPAAEDRVLLVTYSRALVEYIKLHVTRKLPGLNPSPQPAAAPAKTEVASIDQKIYQAWRQHPAYREYSLIQEAEIYPFLRQCIRQFGQNYPQSADITLIREDFAPFLLSEIDWIKACGLLTESEYQAADRLGRMSGQMPEQKQRLPKHSPVRQAVFQLMQLYNSRLDQAKKLDFRDMALIAWQQASSPASDRYTHILVDESQDLSRVQLEFLKVLYRDKSYASITFLADSAQSIYSHAWLVKNRSYAGIGFPMAGRSTILRQNFRTTRQIAAAAYSLFDHEPASSNGINNDTSIVKPASVLRQGPCPVFRRFETGRQETAFITNEIKRLIRLHSYRYSDFAVTARTKRQCAKFLGDLQLQTTDCVLPAIFLQGKGAWQLAEDKVKIMTLHAVKGMEFKVVFIFGLTDGIMPLITSQEEEESQTETDRRLLYVGMTRASEYLYLSSVGQASRFIAEIQPGYLQYDPGEITQSDSPPGCDGTVYRIDKSDPIEYPIHPSRDG